MQQSEDPIYVPEVEHMDGVEPTLEVRTVPLSVVASTSLWSKRTPDIDDYRRAKMSVSGGRRIHSSHRHPIVRSNDEVVGKCFSCGRETCSPFVSSDLASKGNLCFACWETAAVNVYISHAWFDRASYTKAGALTSLLLLQTRGNGARDEPHASDGSEPIRLHAHRFDEQQI